MPLHVHAIGLDVCTNGTSPLRYEAVRLVKVPEKEVKNWLLANKKKL